MKKLYRSKTNKKIVGVCAGIAQYFNIDPTIIRIIWAIVTLFGGAGVILYIICAFVIPEEPDSVETTGRYVDENDANKNK